MLDPDSTSSNNSKIDAVSIRDHESTSLCTEDMGAVLLSDSKSDIATADIIGTSSSSTVSASEKFSYHENSESHKSSEETLLAFNQKPVSARLSAQVSKEMEKAQKALITIVSCMKFLVICGLFLKANKKRRLIELRGNEIPDIKDWLFKHHNWLSYDIQNEILQLLPLTLLCNLNQDIKKNKYFALIVDETTDNSTKEQVSISLRHVNDDFDVFEDFIGFGHMKGAQAVISSKENRAIYIHCFSHSLNSALIHASSTVPEILNVLENVHTLAKFFNESAKRTTIFLNYKADDNPALAKNTTLNPLLKSKESVANRLSAFFEKTSSLFHLEVSVIVFGITEEHARNLQTSDLSITSALRKTEIVMGRLTDLRTEEKFTELEDLDLQPVSLPRVQKPPKRLEHSINVSPPVQYSSPEQFLKQKYFTVIDSIKGEIESRFQHPGVAIYKAFVNVLVKSSNGEVENIRDQVLQICEPFKGDLNVERFTRQLAMLTELTAGRKINNVHDVLDSIRREQPQTRRLFSEVCTCFKLPLVLPATSATAERTFSALRHLKTWLRSTMTQERLNHIAVLAVHWDLAKDFSNLDIANKFISSKESRKLN
ncbi:hypothetical protein PR048_001537 [Dryococelus australis]|uniref:HAT C-terminal dimerisation domain-containing protein n=1 Tax=Dryococelus australis TaxID=614101 RepID=A0ABQ9IHK4_9NEOP|nr:hypothetical protein PR048_001537 [Dryococelus australis]